MTTAATPARRTYLTVVRGLLRSARPKQTAKNGLVLVPVFFTINKWWEPNDIAGMLAIVGLGFAAFALFTIMSGVVYLINDAFDADSDRAHPVKRNRPIAAGIVPIPLAIAVAGVLGAAGIAAAFLMSYEMGFVALGYLVLNVGYSLILKRLVILDVAAIAAGFVIRATAGSLAIEGSTLTRLGVETSLDLTISPWLYVVTGLGALFIALAKRRSELAEAGDRSASQRPILSDYSLPFLDQLIGIVATSTLVAYILYTFSGGITGANVPENNTMMLTAPFVAYGLFRYLYLVHRRNGGETPEEILLTDRPFIINLVLWITAASAVLILNS